jgi:transcriptional regulator with XRE-family HTH domain
MVMRNGKIDFGAYIHQLRTEHQYSLKKVAEILGVDISLLSKIEHGERQVQSHMLKPLSELFGLDLKNLQIQFLNQKIEDTFGEEPYFNESIKQLVHNKSLK